MPEFFTYFPSAFQAFVLTALLIELTPGPNMGYLAVVAIGQGKSAGYAAVAGVALGLFIIGMAAAYGLAVVISSNEMVYHGLRYAGVIFLLYLAWEGWRGGGSQLEIVGGIAHQFMRGLLNNLLNPKAALFYVSVLPNFVDAHRPALPQTLLLTMTYVGIATLIHLMIVTLATYFRQFTNQPNRERNVRRGLSLALAIFALWFAWSTAR
jgi:threonine/homoserine/homoserine lactone efflux protein